MGRKLYRPDGYPDIEYLDSRSCPFNVLLGGRGTGKTYGLLKYYLLKGEQIIYMRRTGEQSDITATEEMTPYKTILRDMNLEYEIPRKGKIKSIYIGDSELPSAYFVGLSTISNLRGFDASNCKAIVYDEFIPEQNARTIKNEGLALMNAYETVNRNRELEEQEPLKLWMLSNTNDIMSPVLSEFGLLKIALSMEKNKTEEYVDKKRGIQIVNFFSSPISKKKADTALYRVAGDDYKRMAIRSSFSFDASLCVSRRLQEYTPVVSLGELTFYRHKSKYLFYATVHKSGSAPSYGSSDKELARFMRSYGYIYEACALGYMEYENIDIYYMTNILLKK